MSRADEFIAKVPPVTGSLSESNIVVITEGEYLTDATWEEWDGTSASMTVGVDEPPSIMLSLLSKNGVKKVYEYEAQTDENPALEVLRKFNDMVEVAQKEGLKGFDWSEWSLSDSNG